jgi:hypothetical protein
MHAEKGKIEGPKEPPIVHSSARVNGVKWMERIWH